jgi:hypothetical protein
MHTDSSAGQNATGPGPGSSVVSAARDTEDTGR